uniref:Uncharacterized protein n=1 Tax=Ditylenchus dipsaci TaxID=166011 RepID=A0A915ETA6_9BILA
MQKRLDDIVLGMQKVAEDINTNPRNSKYLDANKLMKAFDTPENGESDAGVNNEELVKLHCVHSIAIAKVQPTPGLTIRSMSSTEVWVLLYYLYRTTFVYTMINSRSIKDYTLAVTILDKIVPIIKSNVESKKSVLKDHPLNTRPKMSTDLGISILDAKKRRKRSATRQRPAFIFDDQYAENRSECIRQRKPTYISFQKKNKDLDKTDHDYLFPMLKKMSIRSGYVLESYFEKDAHNNDNAAFKKEQAQNNHQIWVLLWNLYVAAINSMMDYRKVWDFAEAVRHSEAVRVALEQYFDSEPRSIFHKQDIFKAVPIHFDGLTEKHKGWGLLALHKADWEKAGEEVEGGINAERDVFFENGVFNKPPKQRIAHTHVSPLQGQNDLSNMFSEIFSRGTPQQKAVATSVLDKLEVISNQLMDLKKSMPGNYYSGNKKISTADGMANFISLDDK